MESSDRPSLECAGSNHSAVFFDTATCPWTPTGVCRSPHFPPQLHLLSSLSPPCSWRTIPSWSSMSDLHLCSQVHPHCPECLSYWSTWDEGEGCLSWWELFLTTLVPTEWTSLCLLLSVPSLAKLSFRCLTHYHECSCCSWCFCLP